jgi:transposase
MGKTAELKVPEDLQQCQHMIVQMFEQMQSMQGQLDALLRARYGTKSEAVPAGQLRLFGDETKVLEEGPAAPVEVAVQVVSRHGRNRPARELPRMQRLHDVPEEERLCPGCHGMREVIGQETSEQYDYSPASIQIIEHVRIKRACRQCAENVVVASKPASVIEKGLATEGMLAYVATSKFADHLPLNRLEGIFKRDGANISRSTMCDWMAATANCLLPLYQRMKELVLKSEVIWTDDTPVKMQDRQDERNMRNARVWVYLGDKTYPYTIFDFTESRKRDGPLNFLSDFKGFLQADAFSGYDCIYASGTVYETACWAHARRKFFDALGTNGKASGEALAMIQALYLIEKEYHSASDDERLAQRQSKSMAILEDMKKWLDHQKVIALPKSPLGKAVTYTLNNWKALNTFTSRGDLTIDNNKSENALRSMAVGRKNWLFMGSKTGGQTATIIASFLSTCKRHDIHPRVYLTDVLTRLARGEANLDILLPGNWRPTCA